MARAGSNHEPVRVSFEFFPPKTDEAEANLWKAIRRLEPLNPALAVTGSIPQDPQQQTTRYWWWMRTWYEHQNLRDERVEAFASLLWEGVHTYTYVARATNFGTFIVPPAKAEEMYSPEVFGRSASDVVIVE